MGFDAFDPQDNAAVGQKNVAFFVAADEKWCLQIITGETGILTSLHLSDSSN